MCIVCRAPARPANDYKMKMTWFHCATTFFLLFFLSLKIQPNALWKQQADSWTKCRSLWCDPAHCVIDGGIRPAGHSLCAIFCCYWRWRCVIVRFNSIKKEICVAAGRKRHDLCNHFVIVRVLICSGFFARCAKSHTHTHVEPFNWFDWIRFGPVLIAFVTIVFVIVGRSLCVGTDFGGRLIFAYTYFHKIENRIETHFDVETPTHKIHSFSICHSLANLSTISSR